MSSSIYSRPIIPDISVNSITVDNGGSGYTSPPTVTIAQPPHGITAEATAVLTGDAVTAINLTINGKGYTTVPPVVITGGGGTGASATAVLTTLAADANILDPGLLIDSSLVGQNRGGVLRLLFSFEFGSSPAAISIKNQGQLKGILNADNTFNIVTDGYYRFDIDVETNDIVNISASESIQSIRELRAHLILFGA